MSGYRLNRVWASPTPSDSRIDEFAGIFVTTLAGFGAAMPGFAEYDPEPQKERARSLSRLVAAAEAMAEEISKLDSAALGCATYHVAKELIATEQWTDDVFTEYDGIKLSERASALTPWSAMNVAAEWKDDGIKWFTAVGVGVRNAAKELPPHRFDVRAETATAIKRLFDSEGLPFIESETSYAAACTRAVFQLGGFQKDAVKYWVGLVGKKSAGKVRPPIS